MKSNAALAGLLTLLACGLGIWGVVEFRRRTQLEAEVALLTRERDVLRETANQKLALRAETEVRSDGPQGLGPDHAEALDQERKGPLKAEAESGQNPMSAMADMMKNPEMRDAMKSQMRAGLELQYRDLFDLLGLEPAKQEKLTKLLADRASAGMEIGMMMMGGNRPSDEEMKKKSEETKALTEASNATIKELLGENDYSRFDQYEKSQPERQQLGSLNSQLKDQGIALSEEAESKLMDAMFQERTNMKYDVDFADQKNFDPGKFNETNMARYQEQQAQVRSKIAERAESILSPEQMEVFRKSQEQQATMEKLGMEMGLKMMKPRGNKPNP